MGVLEDIALDLVGGVRGGKPSPRLVEMRAYLPANYLEAAAHFILDHPGPTAIVTGFFIPVPYINPLPDSGSVETDGPPGAYFLGRALRELGNSVTFVSDKWATPFFQGLSEVGDYVEFPIGTLRESETFARTLIEQKAFSLIVSTERCGVTRAGRYLNGRRWDITEFTAKLDPLLVDHPHSVAVGDAGNEMGLGNFAPFIEELPHPLVEPTVTCSTKPVLARCSDWGCYGLIAALSKITNQDLLPTGSEVQAFIRAIVDAGVVTGTGRKRYEVDGRPLEDQAEVIARYRDTLKSNGIHVRDS